MKKMIDIAFKAGWVVATVLQIYVLYGDPPEDLINPWGPTIVLLVCAVLTPFVLTMEDA